MTAESKPLGLGAAAGLAAGSSILGTGLGLLTQNLQNRNNYKWGEKAAESDFERQMEMYERQYKDRSPLNVVNQLKEAGLSKSLMFSGGASGVGGQAQGSSAPQNKMSMGSGAINGANLALTMAQVRNIEADTELKKKQAPKEEETGKSIFIENSRKAYEDYYSKDVKDEAGIYESKHYGTYKIDSDSLRVDKIGNEIYNMIANTDKTTAEKLLTDKKVNGYLQELAIAQQSADANTVKAAAEKLAAEFNYGEYTNWKYWVNKAGEAIKLIK